MALCLQPIQRPFCLPWQVLFSGCTTFTGGSCINLTWYTIFDVCLEGLDYQLVEPPSTIFWWMASFLHEVYPSPELRLRIARRMMDIGGVAKEQEIVHTALKGLGHLEPACQCIHRHFLAEFVRIMTSDEALFSPCFFKVVDMADLVLADDLARLVAFRRHLSPAFLKPEMLSEVRQQLLELLAG